MKPMKTIRVICGAFLMFGSIASFGSTVVAQDIEIALNGYTEPFRSIEVASDETGTIEKVFVREGETVQAGQPLVQLNSKVFNSLLAIAESNKESLGRLNAAEAEVRLRQDRLKKLTQLRTTGDARQEEVDRAQTELAVAEANLQTAHDDQATRQLEYEKIQSQIDRRTIRAPIAGVVVRLHKDIGEFVAPNAPEVLTLVQIDKLLANFTLPTVEADKLRVGEKLPIQFAGSSSVVDCQVDFISPTTDAESDTVLVRLLVENSKYQLRSGQRCKLASDNSPRNPQSGPVN
jgi:RND family efflux transporter MFP subunit